MSERCIKSTDNKLVYPTNLHVDDHTHTHMHASACYVLDANGEDTSSFVFSLPVLAMRLMTIDKNLCCRQNISIETEAQARQ